MIKNFETVEQRILLLLSCWLVLQYIMFLCLLRIKSQHMNTLSKM